MFCVVGSVDETTIPEKPSFVLAAAAVVAPVPPLPIPKVPVTPGVIFALPSKEAVDVLPKLVRIVLAVDNLTALLAAPPAEDEPA